ncbi:MAG: AAA family ATPase [Muribaculaceae bacterium]|nr:AAA family ATPase [Muribaculaceae bacterium]
MMSQLPYEPNEQQTLLIVALAHFMLYAPERGVFLLSGYAGTGKTSLTGALVRTLTELHHACVLMAPTGRAAHVFSDYSGFPAYTIHRKIYRQNSYGSDAFSLAENKMQNTLFIVDEASMIANNTGDGGAVFGTGRLLDDLISYVYNGQGCRLMLMGDVAQLPPVGSVESPALNVNVLQGYGLTAYEMTLRQIARQSEDSGILLNATMLRNIMESGILATPTLDISSRLDIRSVSSEFLMETLSDCYDGDAMEQTIVITRSNRRATLFNTGIRNRILYREEELSGGDMLIVAKNNYLWAEDYKELDFIANGDVLRVRRVRGEVERRYGLRFATVTVELPDHGGLEMDVKVVLDALLSDTPALTREQSESLFVQVWEELPGDKRNRFKELKKHPYFNALQVKFAYAVTCHKAQGGQWNNVFIDMGGIPPEATTTIDYFRWLYTALTRARQQVYLINYFPPTE